MPRNIKINQKDLENIHLALDECVSMMEYHSDIPQLNIATAGGLHFSDESEEKNVADRDQLLKDMKETIARLKA